MARSLSAAAEITRTSCGRRTGECLSTLKGRSAQINGVRFSPDGTKIASCSGELFDSDYSITRLWDVGTGRELKKLQGKTLFPYAELNLLSPGSGCPLQAGTGHGRPGRAPGRC